MTKYINKVVMLLILWGIILNVHAQTKDEIKKITSEYDIAKLTELAKYYSKKQADSKDKALKLAKEKGWEINKTNKDGSYSELMGVTEEGMPIYYSTFNIDAAKSTRTNYLNTGGGLGLNLDGQGMTPYVWDGGIARTTHQEFGGRVTIGDGSSSIDDHATHVMGTVLAAGVQATAKGMASQALGKSYDWQQDITEATIAAANGMLLSNHSYGISIENYINQGTSWAIGSYSGGNLNQSSDAADWDNVLFNAPNYLMVVSAGNRGGSGYYEINPIPIQGNSIYDRLTYIATAKNNLVVANAQDAIINPDGSLASVVIDNSLSSKGPTDDLRIKPDITGNGTEVYSCIGSSDASYAPYWGTSMASPNVMGMVYPISWTK